MRIYIAHSKKFDFKKELYEPLRNSKLNKDHEIIFPHEYSDKPFNSKELLKSFDLIVAEASFPATGLGIELGWADIFNIPIIALCKKDCKLSSSINVLTKNIISYKDSKELISNLTETISNFEVPKPL